MSIQVLSDQLASQIAAGEVVERPSSVVKELIENAIDAGATAVTIDVQNAGRQSIQISDSGSGLPAAEIETAFLRHATSKLRAAEDLNAIRTLGFRGEALAAIAAISQVTVVSRAANEVAGTRLTLAGGVKTGRETVGAPPGTVIAVENLFYNVPARLKFLKSDSTERRLIDEIVTRYGLAYPQIRFRLAHNGRISFQSNGSGSVLDVLVSIYGPDVARQLLEIRDWRLEIEDEPSISNLQSPISISGFIGTPAVHWANRGHIVLFVNGRWVKDNQLTFAVIQAYQSLLPNGRYPQAVLFLALPPDQVDVNVHPAKTEVRFRGDQAPFGEVQRAVRQALVSDSPLSPLSTWSEMSSDGAPAQVMTTGWEGRLDNHAFARYEESPLALEWSEEGRPDEEIIVPASSGERTDGLPIMRVVGQVGAAYIITEGPEGLFLIDQQAAHARVLFEPYQAQWAGGHVLGQPLTVGTAVTLSPTQSTWLNNHLPTLAEIGFQVEPFGPQTFMVRAVPALVAAQDAAHLLLAMATQIERQTNRHSTELGLRLLQIVCETAALRPGQTLSPNQMEQLVKQLERCHDPLTNPQGKPTFIYLSVAQLAREFGR